VLCLHSQTPKHFRALKDSRVSHSTPFFRPFLLQLQLPVQAKFTKLTLRIPGRLLMPRCSALEPKAFRTDCWYRGATPWYQRSYWTWLLPAFSSTNMSTLLPVMLLLLLTNFHAEFIKSSTMCRLFLSSFVLLV